MSTKTKRASLFTCLLVVAMLLCACGSSGQTADSGSHADSSSEVEASLPAESATVEREEDIPNDGFEDDGRIHVYLVGEPEGYEITDSWITAIVYYPDNEHMVIEVGNKEYAFANVDEATWEAFKAAPSKGEFYNSTFRGATQYWVDDYDGTNGDLIVVEYPW